MGDPRYILALDQGTTSSRSILFDRQGAIVASAQKEFPQRYPQPGWVEHDPMEIWSSLNVTMSETLARAGVGSEAVAAVGLTNQRETVVVWDKTTGQPICHAIVWQDRRTAAYCQQLKRDGIEKTVTEKTGLRLDPYFSGTKLRWILDNIDGARAGAENGKLLFGTVDTWLVWLLTGRQVHATDVTNASRTLLFNIDTLDWDDELLELLQVPRVLLPEVRSSSEIYGTIEKNLELKGVPIAGIAGDQQAALFGQACYKPGMAKNTYGTGCFLLMQTGTTRKSSENNLLSTVAWQIDGVTEYALEGSVFIGGAVVQWLRDELQLVQTAEELDTLAATVEDTSGLYLVPAFSGLGAPHWDPYARGTMVGITRGVNRAHLCRAALESIAFQSADLIACMEKDSSLPLQELRVDGGASRSEPLLQFQADLLSASVIRPQCVETTALGAAYLAGLAAGYWESREEIADLWQVDRIFEPTADAATIKNRRQGWNRALERARGWEES